MTDDIFNPPTTEQGALSAENPWPGLETYREADHKFFHGRRGETRELFRLVMRAPLTILFGLSGLGKSSLLRAGLFPLLRQEDVLPIYIRLNFTTEPLNLVWQTKQAIMMEAERSSIEAPLPTEQETLWEFFHRQDADFWSNRNRLVLPLLVFDQFEELFTIGRSSPTRTKASETFLEEVSDLIESRPPSPLQEKIEKDPQDVSLFSFRQNHYKALISLREDFLPELETLGLQMPSISHNRMRLFRMHGAAAMEVVASARHLIDPQVAEEVIRFVAATNDGHLPLEKLQVEPALLSIVCRELNTKRLQKNESRITPALLEGSQEEILGRFYERSIADCPQEARAFIEEKLLTVSGYRDSIAVENALNLPGMTTELIERLVDRRLIRRDEHGEMPRLELTHDLLTKVIAASRDQRRVLEQKELQEREVAANERQARLEERAQNAKRLLWLTGALAILTIAACVLGFAAFQQRQLAEREREIAETAAQAAIKAQKMADQTSQRIIDNVKLRRAALSRDWEALDAFKDKSPDTTIGFKAVAKEYPYKAVGGLPTYRYEMFPNEETMRGGIAGRVALITYIMDNPTFLNPLITTGPDTNFKGTYDGVGCLYKVRVVIEYSDYTRPPTVTEFSMCDVLEIRPFKKPK